MGDGIVRFDELGLWLSVRDLCIMESMENPHLLRERMPGERPLPVFCCANGIDKEKTEVIWHTIRAAWSLEQNILYSNLLGHTMLAVCWGMHMPDHCKWPWGS